MNERMADVDAAIEALFRGRDRVKTAEVATALGCSEQLASEYARAIGVEGRWRVADVDQLAYALENE